MSPPSRFHHHHQVKLLSWQTNKTTEDKEEDNLPLFLKIEEKLLAGLPIQAQYERGNTKDARSPREVKSNTGVFTEVMGFSTRHEGETANEFATSASGEILQQFVDEIATDLENLEANLKGSTCAQRSKKHGVGTHSQTGEREETVNAFKHARKQHATELQLKRTEEEEATATNQTGEGDR